MNLSCPIIHLLLLLVLPTFVLLPQTKSHTDTITVYQPYPHTPKSRASYSAEVKVGPLIRDDTTHWQVGPEPSEGPLAFPKTIFYPDLAIRAELEGRVLVKATISSEGLPKNIHVLWAETEIFVQYAHEAVAATKFIPARASGIPIDVDVLVPIEWTRNAKAHDLDWLLVHASEITLSKTPSMTGGPDYTVVLRKDGTASFEGRANVARLGSFQGKCDSTVYHKLERLLGWFSVFDTTVVENTPTCVALDIVSAVSNGKRVTMHTDGRDERIWAIARIIDKIANDYIVWTKTR